MQPQKTIKRTVLAVDDDEINLMILSKTAQDNGFNVQAFSSSLEARAYLHEYPNKIDIVLLDKMMPGLNGMDLLAEMKRHPVLKRIPVIIQTGDVGEKQLCEGLNEGAFSYLTKPFRPDVLAALLKAAENECVLRLELLSQMASGYSTFLGMLSEAEFVFNGHNKARVLAANIAQLSTNPEFVARGLMELFANAIEHGNLGIGFERKKNWINNKKWEQELLNRIRLPQHQNRMVRVHVQRMLSSIQVTISDQGEGFNVGDFMRIDMKDVMTRSNGRGISIARRLLEDVQYCGKGNEVKCTIKLYQAGHIPMIQNVISAQGGAKAMHH